jgi:hypothetical protein
MGTHGFSHLRAWQAIGFLSASAIPFEQLHHRLTYREQPLIAIRKSPQRNFSKKKSLIGS